MVTHRHYVVIYTTYMLTHLAPPEKKHESSRILAKKTSERSNISRNALIQRFSTPEGSNIQESGIERSTSSRSINVVNPLIYQRLTAPRSFVKFGMTHMKCPKR